MNQAIHTDVSTFFSEIDAGRLEAQLGAALSLCGGALMDNAGTSKVTITFDLKRVANSGQVHIASKMSYQHPTAVGKKSEVCDATTLMHVGKGGRMTYMPESQIDMFKTPATA
jgi:hypothetical protein